MQAGMHAEGNVPQASIVERKCKDENDLRSHKLRLKSPIMTSLHEWSWIISKTSSGIWRKKGTDLLGHIYVLPTIKVLAWILISINMDLKIPSSFLDRSRLTEYGGYFKTWTARPPLIILPWFKYSILYPGRCNWDSFFESREVSQRPVNTGCPLHTSFFTNQTMNKDHEH